MERINRTPNLCVATYDLTHNFPSGETALDGVCLQVPESGIYGFLGPNGAGKTTTLKLILGLLKKQRGEIRIFGEVFETNRVKTLGKIGSMIESPSIYGHLTAEENLEVWRKIYGCPKSRIQDVLKLTGLEKTRGKKSAQFSLGMKQRLSIATALLHAPELLILDEPTNGLDPNGSLEIRELLKNLNRNDGTTILISSHLLSEIERIVTHVGIINHGKILFQGTLTEFMNKRQKSLTIFATGDSAKTFRILREHFGCDARIEAEEVLTPILEPMQIARINRKLVESGVAVYRIGEIESDLEKMFFDLLRE